MQFLLPSSANMKSCLGYHSEPERMVTSSRHTGLQHATGSLRPRRWRLHLDDVTVPRTVAQVTGWRPCPSFAVEMLYEASHIFDRVGTSWTFLICCACELLPKHNLWPSFVWNWHKQYKCLSSFLRHKSLRNGDGWHGQRC